MLPGSRSRWPISLTVQIKVGPSPNIILHETFSFSGTRGQIRPAAALDSNGLQMSLTALEKRLARGD